MLFPDLSSHWLTFPPLSVIVEASAASSHNAGDKSFTLNAVPSIGPNVAVTLVGAPGATALAKSTMACTSAVVAGLLKPGLFSRINCKYLASFACTAPLIVGKAFRSAAVTALVSALFPLEASVPILASNDWLAFTWFTIC